MIKRVLLVCISGITIAIWVYNVVLIKRSAVEPITDKAQEMFIASENTPDTGFTRILAAAGYTYVGNARDPFSGLVPGDAPRSAERTARPAPQTQPFVLDGIMWESNNSLAILRDTVKNETINAKKGDVAGNFRIIKITTNSVTIECQGRTYILQ
ncbi:MAG: hypothetical protein A2268_12845 [Candidatus Raymondbacteria bacterium RifOxyA12_full_50_37]|uniref:Uncharacterized protein n=1 Tax=Candidatus Raymondbacteria bacterium RIFOXYD12_FULL_49_13 TaxID=1817890 RepID=A0A1F7FJ72_UNCRA|nr:MAG: hypothetical protein A2268_12845 [Candidatus Raymondbacteria bacterium RifOxyA12_full_50_37]OGJ90776.1 MAG: hypothetical protein A2248_02145 [Candidatus Raymondbacteria bacterium RIFOXYA2_FULL_49_16]OGJ91655.1 MAG: hypothetical protein A2350_00430 [Candidatus Raymondbacteria bacterium RifOxyB12_full_50_8]OGJ97270.1 MAG: hypothetical protein A2487_16335 [Candidatus Raymondbacteria bacterium RifOxyC12_full_50_8]OGJ97343.1 MAG: hypothetical protein A2453_03425 [Candidatus Raymondbacteria b